MKPIDLTNIQGDLSETLQDYGLAQTNSAKLFKVQAIAKLERDKYEASQWLVLKDQPTDNGRPPSNDYVAMELQDDDEFQELQAEYIDARAEYEDILGMVKYLEYRLESLRTIEATQRVELSHHLKD